MSTRDEIEQAINDLADNAHAIGWNHRHADKTQPSVDHVMALIDAALLAPPAPGEVRLDEAVVQSLREFLGAFDDLPEMGFGDDYAMQEAWDDLLNLRLAINLGPLAAAAAPGAA